MLIDMMEYNVSLDSVVDLIQCFGLQFLSISSRTEQQLVLFQTATQSGPIDQSGLNVSDVSL